MPRSPSPNDERSDVTPVLETRSPAGAGQTLRAVIFGEKTCASFPLAPGTKRIGRGAEADFRFQDTSISRAHAAIHVRELADGGVELAIEDLSSANGTSVRGERLEPHHPRSFGLGEVVDLGLATLVVQSAPRPEQLHRRWSQADFELRLREECERARVSGARFSVVFIALDPAARLSELEAALLELLRPFDVAGELGPGELELILIDMGGAAARELVDQLRRRVRIEAGIAEYGVQGRRAEDLLAAARAQLDGEPELPRAVAASSVVIASPAMESIHRLVDRVAKSDIGVLLLGETGAGKDVIAEQIHARSRRAERPMLRLNCGALAGSVLESELFGHERGAFTGAEAAKPGLFESVDGGTVFLDEVGELPEALQVKLLRVLEDKRVIRVGGLQPREFDVRFIAATNRDLENDPRFRRDLYFRLAGMTISVPPLRERREEIPALARHFAERALAREGIAGSPDLEPEAVEMFLRHAWPGNVRELRNMIERAVVLAGGPRIGVEHLPVEQLRAAMIQKPRAAPAIDPAMVEERQRILAVLEECAGNQSRAAVLLGMARSTLALKLDQYQVPRPRKGHRAARGKPRTE